MISRKKLIKMARKWQRIAAIKRKRIALPRVSKDENEMVSKVQPVADKGHFVFYTTDERRFMFPVAYLSNPIIRELLKMSEEEFGMPSDGPITLPCDAVLMEYIVSLIRRGIDKNMEKALLMSMSMASGRCLSSNSLHQERSSQQLLVC